MSSYIEIHKSSLPIVRDKSIKSGCVTVELQEDGTFVGYNHIDGYIVSTNQGLKNRSLHFLASQDNKRSSDWILGATWENYSEA